MFNELEKLIKMASEYERKEFKNAIDLGLQNGDMVIFKDGEVIFVNDVENERIKYKQIAEVKRAKEWEQVKVRKIFRGRKTNK